MKKLFALSVLILLPFLIKSQTCGTCSITINNVDSTAYTLSSGETLCIDTTGNFIGTITLNGGTLCNKGLFNPKVINFNSGNIDNYGNVSISSGINLGNSKSINNKPDAIVNMNGTLSISGGSFVNNGVVNISQGINNNSGTLNNTGILNCTQISGSNTFSNSGVINTN